MSDKSEKVRPLHSGVMLKSGKPVNDLSKSELVRVLQEHTDATHPDYNLKGVTISDVSQALRPRLEAEEAQRSAALSKAAGSNADHTPRLNAAIVAAIKSRPEANAETIADALVEMIEADSDRIAREKDWRLAMIDFPRKNKKGHPYARATILRRIRKLRRQ